MLLFGHIGVTLGIFFGVAFFIPQLRTIINPTYLIIGALLPDLVDKPLGRVIFASTLENGRIVGHTLLFFLVLFLIGLYFYKKRGDIRIISLSIGSFFHLIEDNMWTNPKTLFWPLLGSECSQRSYGSYWDGIFKTNVSKFFYIKVLVIFHS